MLNNNVSFAQAYVSERAAVLSDRTEPIHSARRERKAGRLWQRILSLWL
jgi:hypothetical protein